MAGRAGVVAAALAMAVALGPVFVGMPAVADQVPGAGGGSSGDQLPAQMEPAQHQRDAAGTGEVFVVLRTTNARSQPTSASEALARLEAHETVRVLGRAGDEFWLEIDHDGGTAFVFAPLLHPLDEAEASAWEAAAGGDRAALEQYLDAYPYGAFADLALDMLTLDMLALGPRPGDGGGRPHAPPMDHGAYPGELDRLVASQGEWVRDFGVDPGAPRPPPEFSHFFMLPEVLSGDYVDAGAIVTGSEWDNDGAPLWCVAYGYSKDDGCWYINLTRLTHLGPDWDDRFADWSDMVNDRHGKRVGWFFDRPYSMAGVGGVAGEFREYRGAWLQDFDVDQSAPAPPPVFDDYFLVLDTIDGGFVDAGAIVTGERWDTDGVPLWCTVYGYSEDDGCWYLLSADLVHLGAEWDPAWTAFSDAINAAAGRREGVFHGSQAHAGPAQPAGGDHISMLQSAVGLWVAEFGVDEFGAEPPPQYGHYFIMGGLTDSAIDAGAIVRGSGWDDDGLPRWCVVYGRADDDGCRYLFLDELAYLGPEWLPEYAEWSDEINRRVGRGIQGMFNRPHERFGY